MVEFRRVSKGYGRAAGGRAQGLVDVTFTVGVGELAVVVGANGAGKSTLLRLAYGGERPSQGSVVVEGAEVGRLAPRALRRLRRQMGLVLEGAALLPDRTALGNVSLLLDARGVPRRQARSQALSALRDVGLGARANAFPAELAAGERQRVALARALAGGPHLLLADEPAASLDEEATRDVVEILRGAHTRGVTVLVATRSPALAQALKGRLLTLEAGRLRHDEGPRGVG